MARTWTVLAVASVLAGTIACSSLGPATIPRDQFDYGAAIGRSSNEQLLLNMIRLRYDEPPVFLTVSSVISQYRRSGTLSLGAGVNNSATGGDSASIGAAGVWVDRPTITYTPISGSKFASTLLKPLTAQTVFELLQAGWPADQVIRLAIVSVNGLQGESTRPTGRKQADPEFWEMMELWASLRNEKAIGTRIVRREDETETVLYFRTEHVTPEVEEKQTRLRQLLLLDPAIEEYDLAFGLIPDETGQVAVLTRSIHDILVNLAWHLPMPETHIASGRTDASYEGTRAPPIVVHHAVDEPEDAFVSVRNRGFWFYIDDRDRQSKRTFSFLHMLMSLAETPEPARGPILTIN
jgi:hypothetical protein